MRASVYILIAAVPLAACSKQDRLARRGADLCQKNMTAIWWALRDWEGAGGDLFPASFDSLNKTSNPAVFVCPSSGHPVGSMSNVDEWTDYIYLSGHGMDGGILADVGVLICPPENHAGQYGNVVWGDGSAKRLSAGQARELIDKPWHTSRITFANTASGGDFNATNWSRFDQYMRTNTTIHIPLRFRSAYGKEAKN